MFYLFIDDHTRYCWVYLMKYHFEFFEIYTAFRAIVKTQHSNVIKCFSYDLGGEYTSNKVYELLTLDGTIHQIRIQIILSKMALLKENIGTLLKLLVLSCSLLLFLVCFEEKLFLRL